MTSEHVVPNQVRDTFVAALTPVTSHLSALPDPLPLGTRIGLTAPEGSSRERIRIRAEHDEAGYHLDFYKEGNGGETSSHCRIREDGSITPLENLILVRQHFDDPEQAQRERERRAEHNKRVVEILRAKGLYM
ncbi:hypothetical protein ABZ319_10680 [Nocardia sp. NPDC005978]|uniref:hypothetical protein n=1 Tax=Nocardia sp. NPDC005978 TaxID=3156725 RepID=UPI0033B92754